MCHSSSVNLHRGPLSRVAWIRIVLSLRKRRSVWESSFGVCACLATLATSWNQSSVTPSSVSCLLLMQRAAKIFVMNSKEIGPPKGGKQQRNKKKREEKRKKRKEKGGKERKEEGIQCTLQTCEPSSCRATGDRQHLASVLWQRHRAKLSHQIFALFRQEICPAKSVKLT